MGVTLVEKVDASLVFAARLAEVGETSARAT